MVKKGKGVLYVFPDEGYAKVLEGLNVKEGDKLSNVLMGEE